MWWRRKRWEKKAVREWEGYHHARRTPLDQLDSLVVELIRIAERERLAASARAREIGARLNRTGGLPAMETAVRELSYWHPDQRNSLSQAWDGVGDWRF